MVAVKKPYNAPARAEQATRTRTRILQAAATAFAEQGWAGTTIAAVARAAGVSPQAVHLSVGAKPALLIGAVQHLVAGSQPQLPLADREPFRLAYSAEATLEQRAAAFAAGTAEIYLRVGRLFLVLAQAAASDPELALLWNRNRKARLHDCRRLVDVTGSRPREHREHICDLLFVQTGPGVYNDLVGDRRWSTARYREWLTGEIEHLLRLSGRGRVSTGR